MISRVSSNNKGKQAKMKNSVKKQRPNKQTKKGTKKQKTASPGGRTWYISTCKQLLDHGTSVTHIN